MLTDLELEHGQKCLRIWQGLTSLPMVSHHVEFAKAIEAEVRKQDTELIRQMLEIIESVSCDSVYEQNCNVCGTIEAGRARLENT